MPHYAPLAPAIQHKQPLNKKDTLDQHVQERKQTKCTVICRSHLIISIFFLQKSKRPKHKRALECFSVHSRNFISIHQLFIHHPAFKYIAP